MKVKYCGASIGVTGSCHMISTDNHKILLDCGQFQGGKEMDRMNEEPFPFNPAEIECVILSHAHIDHCGRLPLLVKRGFKGPIYCTDATADLLDVMLKDSAYIHEKDAEWQTRKNLRTGKPPVEPLYTIQDSEAALRLVKPILYDQLVELNPEMKIVFNDAGHILGSAITELWVTEGDKTSKIVFSGDLGVENRPILRDPVKIKKADFLIMETTYGNRLHPENATSIDDLIKITLKTIKRGGSVIIPSFAVGRSQELIYQFNMFYEHHPEYADILGNVNVYIDSPMATTATEVFKKNAQVFDEETKNYILSGDHPLDFPNLKFTRNTADSQMLNVDKHPDTGAAFSELVVPQWEEHLELAARCAEMTPLGYFGADIATDRRRGPLLLELNARPGLAIQIANGHGLLSRLRLIESLPPGAHAPRAEKIAFAREQFG